jgi:Pyruvate/2-oxoacid:ferredoxin oxidoreductase delta subunit
MEDQKQETDRQLPVLIIGDEPWAGLAATELKSSSVKVLGCGNGQDFARITGCTGQDGDFSVRLEQGGIVTRQAASRILILGEAFTKSAAGDYGLAASDFAGSVKDVLQKPESWQGKTVVFVTGVKEQSHQSVTLEVLNAALLLKKKADAEVFILCGQLQVAAPGLERLLFEARTTGVTVFRLNGPDALQISRQEKGPYRLLFTDPASRRLIELAPDFIVLPRNPAPAPLLADMAALFGLETDEKGFLQSANVHRLPLGSNRAGVMVAGPAKDAATPAQYHARSILAAALALAPGTEAAPENRQAVINSRACIHCLTCFRVCPHKAICQNDGKLTVMTDACQACGICAAECPPHCNFNGRGLAGQGRGSTWAGCTNKEL